jgi:hypothetical protein
MAERPFVLSDATSQRLNEIFPSQGDAISVSELVKE